MKDAYSSTALPIPGRSDPNLVLLTPAYKSVVQQQPGTIQTVRKWSPYGLYMNHMVRTSMV